MISFHVPSLCIKTITEFLSFFHLLFDVVHRWKWNSSFLYTCCFVAHSDGKAINLILKYNDFYPFGIRRTFFSKLNKPQVYSIPKLVWINFFDFDIFFLHNVFGRIFIGLPWECIVFWNAESCPAEKSSCFCNTIAASTTSDINA